MPIPKTIAAYLAGIIDGEGTITLAKESRSRRYEVRVIVKNTNLELMNWLKENFGGFIRKYKKIPFKTQIYDWIISGSKAVKLLEEIAEFLIIKKGQYLVVITYTAAKIEAKKDGSPAHRGKEGLEKWQEAFDYLKREITKLNKRGQSYAYSTK